MPSCARHPLAMLPVTRVAWVFSRQISCGGSGHPLDYYVYFCMYFFIWSLILGDIVVFPTLAPSKSFDSIDATDQPPPTLPPPGAYPARLPNRGGSVFTDRSDDDILDGGNWSDDEILGGSGGKPNLSILSRVGAAQPEERLSEEWYNSVDAPVTEEDPIDESSPSAIMVVECDSGCVGSEVTDPFRGKEGLRSSKLSKKYALPRNGSVSDTVSIVEFLVSFSASLELSTSNAAESDV
mmetsp:Transcript_5445/g.11845  ORF Transcript_5445/g.11845 Transcript_5445/m.11845 type:complete len:238 (+) Transcript_5445:103-816(+)